MNAQALKDKIIQRPLAAVILFFLFTRIVTILVYRHVTIFPDSEGYTLLAQLVSDLDLSGYNGQRSPGYPLLIALSGNVLSIAVALQMALGLLSAILLYKTLLLLRFTLLGAVITTITANSLVHVIFYETAILTESFTLFLITTVFYLLLSGFFSKKNWKKTLLFGFVLGWLVFTKPFYIFLPFVIYGLYVIKNFSFRNVINSRIILLLFPLAAFLGWSAVNKANTGHFVSTTFFGFNLAQNCVYFAEKSPPEYKAISDIYVKHRNEAIENNRDVAMSIWYAYDELEQKTGLPFVELSDELGRYGKATMRQNPWNYIKQVGLSWSEFWKTGIYINYHDFKVPYANKAILGLWLVQDFLLQALKVIFVLLLPYQVWQFIRTRKVTAEVIICTIVLATSLLQAMAAFGNNSRFSYPFEFYMGLVVMLTFARRIPAMIKQSE